ncbi:ABC transporter ATP-binding protein [Ktedonobacteria bacterium brp13]|nr:ABC transporter ATP-binding protein [Ktedonobacteria bacterium brp13]
MTQTTQVTTAVVEARGITRDFKTASGTVHVLRGIDLSIARGEFVALRGRSGSGKTTLLNILVGLDNPTAGQVQVLGRDLATLREPARAALRRESVGILFQNAHLFPALSALENVELALRLQAALPAERKRRALEALEMVGLAGRVHHRALELSGGEQQRVALARALAHQPRLVVADEPTGNLDLHTGQSITHLLQQIVRQTSIGLLVATHDTMVITTADRIVQINDGVLVEQ